MERSRLFSLMLAVLTAVFVMMIGKSCVGDINRQNKRHRQKENTNAAQESTMPDYGKYGLEDSPHYVPPQTEATEPEVTEPQVEVVTDMLGRVVETIPVTQPPAEREEIPVSTKEKTLLEQYHEQYDTPAPEVEVQKTQPAQEYELPDSVDITIR